MGENKSKEKGKGKKATLPKLVTAEKKSSCSKSQIIDKGLRSVKKYDLIPSIPDKKRMFGCIYCEDNCWV